MRNPIDFLMRVLKRILQYHRHRWILFIVLIVLAAFSYTLSAHFGWMFLPGGSTSSCTGDSIDACKDKSGIECERCCDRECRQRCSKFGNTVVEKCRDLCYAKCNP